MISEALSNLQTVLLLFHREAGLLAFNQLKPNQNLEYMLFSNSSSTSIFSQACQATYVDLDLGQLALSGLFGFSFFFFFFLNFFCNSSVHPVALPPLPCLANTPARANVLSMPASSQELMNGAPAFMRSLETSYVLRLFSEILAEIAPAG